MDTSPNVDAGANVDACSHVNPSPYRYSYTHSPAHGNPGANPHTVTYSNPASNCDTHSDTNANSNPNTSAYADTLPRPVAALSRENARWPNAHGYLPTGRKRSDPWRKQPAR